MAKEKLSSGDRHPEGRLIVSRQTKASGDGVRTADGPAANLALEEALFLRNESGFVLRIWENSESVIIGRAQLARFETDVDYCQANAVPIVRRFTAGGAVYNGPGNLNWSLFISRAFDSGPRLRYVSDPHAIFRSASKPLLAALATLGVDARLDPPNSILTGGGKVSGMAAYVSRTGMLCHGTLLVAADLGRLKALTTPSPGVLERKYTRSRDVRTANVGVDIDSFIHGFVGAVADESRLEFSEATPDEHEVALSRELLATRYSNASWNLGDPFVSSDGHARTVGGDTNAEDGRSSGGGGG
jgi:lipoate---protein ligase